MLTLPLPNLSAHEVISACISTIADSGLKARLLAIEASLCAAADDAASLASKGEAHHIPRVSEVAGVVGEELRSLYSEHMVASKGGARPFYDRLMNSSPRKRCPACGIGVVSALDHNLPKSRYSNLSVSPFNLVPCCFDCNKAKHMDFPVSQERQICHPYFDDFTFDQWIIANVDAGPPVSVTYKVEAPLSWPDVNQRRVEHHFRTFRLEIPYTSNGNDELVTLKRRLSDLYSKGGSDQVREYLEEEAQRFSYRLNSWQHVLYQNLSSNVWFQNNGFADIPDPK